MKKRTPAQYADALYHITKDLSGTDLSEAIREFVVLLNRDRKLSNINRIIAAFERKVKKENGVVVLDITFAREPKKALLKAVESTFGKQVEAHIAVDERLVGGFVVRTEDTILDASVHTRLDSLSRLLIA